MKRWFWFAICALLGLTLVVAGWLMPVHLRALDIGVLQRAARKSRPLALEGALVLEQGQFGPARMISEAARSCNAPEANRLGAAVDNYARIHPRVKTWGSPDPSLDRLLPEPGLPEKGASNTIVPVLVRSENRQAVLEWLRASQDPAVLGLLQLRMLTNTVLFPPSVSSSGQALDTALALAGLLMKQQRLSPSLRETLVNLAGDAVAGGSPQRLEQALLDLASLGQRFDWTQLCAFVGPVADTETLRHLARLARRADGQLPVLFSAVYLSQAPGDVAKYLMNLSQSGLHDLAVGLRYGVGGLREVLRCGQQVFEGGLLHWVVGYDPFGAFYYSTMDYCWLMPGLALAGKCLLYLAGGFLLAAAWPLARRPATALEAPLRVPGFPAIRELLFALGFLLVVLLLSEPFLAQESQKVDFPFRLRLPMMGAAAPAGIAQAHVSNMNLTLLMLLLFFVLQALIYTACLVKLAEIRRQNVVPRMKIRLLENEEHLFDAGLYLGFVGTIIALILVSVGLIKQPSLMAAYSSTSFGIIFVSILKIFHVRPLRRKLILESEAVPS